MIVNAWQQRKEQTIRGNQVRKIRSITRLVLRSILNTCNDIPVDHCCVGISTMKMIKRACKSFFIHKKKGSFNFSDWSNFNESRLNSVKKTKIGYGKSNLFCKY